MPSTRRTEGSKRTVLGGSISKTGFPDGYSEDNVYDKVPLYADSMKAESEAESEAEMSTAESDDKENRHINLHMDSKSLPPS